MNDDTEPKQVAEAVIAFMASRLATAGIAAALVNGGFEKIVSSARIVCDTALHAQQRAELARMEAEGMPASLRDQQISESAARHARMEKLVVWAEEPDKAEQHDSHSSERRR
jgi:hypothetical protein